MLGGWVNCFKFRRGKLVIELPASKSAKLAAVMNVEVAKVLKHLHYPLLVMLNCVRWYVAYPLSPRHLEQMTPDGISGDHSTVRRWALQFLLASNTIFRRHKRPVGKSCRMDMPYILVRGQWKYLYRAVDKAGNALDLLLRLRREQAAARRFFEKAIAQRGHPDSVTIDGRTSKLAGPAA